MLYRTRQRPMTWGVTHAQQNQPNTGTLLTESQGNPSRKFSLCGRFRASASVKIRCPTRGDALLIGCARRLFESCAMFTRDVYTGWGLSRRQRNPGWHTGKALGLGSAVRLYSDRPISGVSAGQYIVGLLAQTLPPLVTRGTGRKRRSTCGPQISPCSSPGISDGAIRAASTRPLAMY
jgi:hypothetical protein